MVDFCNFWRVICLNTFGVPIVLTALQWGLGVSGSGQAASGSGPEGRDFNTFEDSINTLLKTTETLAFVVIRNYLNSTSSVGSS